MAFAQVSEKGRDLKSKTSNPLITAKINSSNIKSDQGALYMANELNPRVLEKETEKASRSTTADIKREEDILEISTIYTKQVFSELSKWYQAFKSSTYYRIIIRTTQPATLIVMLAVIFLGAALYPARDPGTVSNVGLKFMYVISTATHYGSQIWMTFISGLALYFSLPRHDFGEVQKVLFPLYFTFTGLLSAARIFSQARLSGINTTTGLLVVCFLVEIFVRVLLCNPLVSLIKRKNAVEKQHGLGREIGKLAKNSELFLTPSYIDLHNKFRRLHMLIAMANMTGITLSTIHIWMSLSEGQGC